MTIQVITSSLEILFATQLKYSALIALGYYSIKSFFQVGPINSFSFLNHNYFISFCSKLNINTSHFSNSSKANCKNENLILVQSHTTAIEHVE